MGKKLKIFGSNQMFQSFSLEHLIPESEYFLFTLMWEHSEQYRTSPCKDLVATAKSLEAIKCSKALLGSEAASIVSMNKVKKPLKPLKTVWKI